MTRPTTNPDPIKVTFRLTPSLVRRTKHYAVDKGLTVQAVVTQALEAFLRGARA